MRKLLLFVFALFASVNCIAKWDADAEATVFLLLVQGDIDAIRNDNLKLNDISMDQYQSICTKNTVTFNGKQYKLSEAKNSKDSDIRNYYGGGAIRARSCIILASYYEKVLLDAVDQSDFGAIESLNGKLTIFLKNAPTRIEAGNAGEAWTSLREKVTEKNRKVSSILSSRQSRIASSKSGHGGIADTYRFEDGKGIQVKCQDGTKKIIERMDSGRWWYAGQSYEAEYAAAEAVCR